jgi:Fic family protein
MENGVKPIDIGPTAEIPQRLPFLLSNQELQPLVDKSNAEYLAWDKFKRHPMPQGVTAEEAWYFVKFARSMNRKHLPIKDTQGRTFHYWLPGSFQAQLHRIDAHAGMSMVAMPESESLRANRERYLVSSLMEEAIASSQLEGASTTRGIAKEMLRTHRAPRNRSEQMVLNNYRTISRIKELTKEPMSVELLCSIQRQVTELTLKDESASGRLRVPAEDDIAVVTADGDVVHQPPPGASLAERLKVFCDFANEEPDDTGLTFRHPVVTAIILHFWLGYEHPFVDGNGRTARAVFLWYMLKRGYWLMDLLPISTIIRKSPAQYGRAFILAEQDENDVSYFLAYNLRAINLALDNFLAYVRRKQQELDAVQALAAFSSDMNVRQRSLIAHALKNPGFVYTVRSHMTSQGISIVTARNDLYALAARGLLEQRREGKKMVWISPPDLATRLRRPA